MTDRGKVIELRPSPATKITSSKLRMILREYMAIGRDSDEVFSSDEIAIASEALLAAVDAIELERAGDYGDSIARLDAYFLRVTQGRDAGDSLAPSMLDPSKNERDP